MGQDAREMAQWVKCILGKHKDLNSDSPLLMEKLGSCNPIVREIPARGPLELTDQPAQEAVSSRHTHIYFKRWWLQ